VFVCMPLSNIIFKKNEEKNIGVLFLLIILSSQFSFIPWFYHSYETSKSVTVGFLVLMIFFNSKSFIRINKLIYSSLLLVFLLLFCSTSDVNSLLKVLFFLLLILYSVEVFKLSKNSNFTLLFFDFYSFFILIVAILGVYEYFNSLCLGRTYSSLIPYVMPPNLSSRVAGIYGQPNLFALLLLTGILVYLYQYLHNVNFSFKRYQLFMFIPLMVVSVAFFLTNSRAGMLALLTVTIFIFGVVIRKHYPLHGNGYRVFFQAFGVILVSYGVATLLISFSSSFAIRGLADTGISVEARFVFWTSAVLMFLDFPLLGIGLGNFKLYLPDYVVRAHDLLGFVQYESMGYTNWVHNELLQLLCEGGGVVFLFVASGLLWFCYQLYLFYSGKVVWTPLKLYSHLLLLPFLVQSMFSWPMRQVPLLVLFFTFFGILLSQYQYETISIPPFVRILVRCCAVFGILIIIFVGIQEIKMNFFSSHVKERGIVNSFKEFEELVRSPYAEYPLLLRLSSRYLSDILMAENIDLIKNVFPYVKKMVDMQGAHWQWFNLSLIYNALGREREARNAVHQAIDRYPTNDKYWAFLHYLNMVKASRETGRPIEDFLPIPPGGTAADLEGLFDIDGKTTIYN